MIGKRKTINRISDDDLEITKNAKKKKIFLVVAVLIVLIIIGGLGLYAYNANKQLKMLNDPALRQQAAKEEINSWVNKISKHIILPTGEDPMMATITDINALVKEQPFYQGAANGDIILIYSKAKQGYVYDPTKDIIVKMGPVFIDNSNSAGQTGTGTSTNTNTPTTTNNTTGSNSNTNSSQGSNLDTNSESAPNYNSPAR